jgi:hypothetical protein
LECREIVIRQAERPALKKVDQPALENSGPRVQLAIRCTIRMPTLQRQIVSPQKRRSISFGTSKKQGWAFTHDTNLSEKSALIKTDHNYVIIHFCALIVNGVAGSWPKGCIDN